MMRYRLTEAAERDIRAIVHHIRTAQGSPQNAKLVVARLKAAFNRLAAPPRLGHTREELGDDDALVFAVTGLLVVYDRAEKPLTVLRVIHPSRDLNRIDPRS